MLQLLVGGTLLFAVEKVDEPVAMTLNVKGGVVLYRGKNTGVFLNVASVLKVGDHISTTPSGEAIVLILADGRRQRIPAKSQVTIGIDGCRPNSAIETVKGPSLGEEGIGKIKTILNENPKRWTAGGMAAGVIVKHDPLRLKDAQTEVQLLSPLSEAGIVSVRPTLTWPGESKEYVVWMFAGDEKSTDRRGLWIATVKTNRLEYPRERKPLARGMRYHFHVIANQEKSEVILSSAFHVLKKDVVDVLSQLKPLQDTGSSGDLFWAALVCESHRAYDLSLPLYQKLTALEPHEKFFTNALADHYARAARLDIAKKMLLKYP